MIFIAAAAIVLVGTIAWFWTLESRGRRHTIFVVLVVTLLVEAIIAGRSANVPVGLLRPRVLGQDFRPPDLVIVSALVVHLLRARRVTLGPLTFAWMPFIVLYVVGVAVGIMYGWPVPTVLFQGKAAFYIVGGAVIASGVDLRRLHQAMPAVGAVLAPLVPIGFLVYATGTQINLSLPGQQLREFGRLSNDTITLLTVIGAAVILTEAVRRTPRLWVFVAGTVLLGAPLAGSQRASYLSLAVVVVCLGLFVAGPTWKRRSTVTPLDTLLGAAAVSAALLVGFLATESPGVVVSTAGRAFTGPGNAQSAESRISLVDEARAMIAERPWFGSGVGARVETTKVTGEVFEASAHNLFLDVALRVGVIGAAFLALAIVVSIVVGLRVWQRAASSVVASIGASAVIVILGVITKSLVEPGLDKFRLSLAIGIALGCLAACHRAVVEERSQREADRLAQRVAVG